MYNDAQRGYSMKSRLERKDLKAFEPLTFKYPLLLSLGCKVSLKSPTRNTGTSKADFNMVIKLIL